MKYFVSYAYWGHDGKTGFGNCNEMLIAPGLIKESIREAELVLTEELDVEKVVILFFQRLDG